MTNIDNDNAASLDPWERLEAFANKMGEMMHNYELPEDCNGIICSELDITNEMLDKGKTSLTTAVPELVVATRNDKRYQYVSFSKRKNGSIQNSVSRFIILNQPLKLAEAETSSENGPSDTLVGGAGFSWSGFTRIIFFIKQSTYQSFNSLSSLPSKNIAN